MDMKRNYYEDIQLLDSGVLWFWFIALIASLITLPFLIPSYHIYMINYMAINVIVTVGLNILVGYTGQISLGHAGFFAIGAYGTVLMMTNLHLPFLLALILSALIAAFFGFILGLPALRLEGPYLAIATLGFGMAITQVIGRWQVFGGRMGLEVPELALGPLAIDTDRRLYFIIITMAFLLILAARNLMKTRVGRAFIAIRDSDIAAETMGVNLTLYKTLAFAVSAFYAGIAGGLMAFLLGFISPSSFNFILSIYFLAFVIVGGLGSILGSIMGGVVMTWLLLVLDKVQELPYLGEVLVSFSERWMNLAGLPNIASIIFGLIIILLVVFEPLGLYGFWIRTKIYWKTWPF
ncbi:MAG: branched-chain amino acid ABC transporter permease [Deltaproteobacteria bacterium]|nr:branched-chain amino acid ABC transporter permease [Deltaproteobacteria bacterium]MBW2049330.1 branched-chain amino acid ABC transporter permease [Deltaproteobacteria bacterium]MBW2112437.1 branched-chain amino acid ABC transporter permease [Deltaproteobacteria bacterium]MBW2354647.1 branched-chain amino acid ABC transporter permease [Deltaproteobacteria bacterium]HDZ90222.1 branched-chain amino acid ABC transporter permease [Deltaproteobacteria bacterium]